MQMHTLDQILVGAVFGSLIGSFWFLFYTLLNYFHVFSYIEGLSISKFFYVRDSFSLIGNPQEFDFNNYWKYREEILKQSTKYKKS